MAMVLLFSGAVFAVLYVLYSLALALLGKEDVKFTGTLLAYLAALVPLASVIVNQLSANPAQFVNMAAAGIAVGTVVLSLLVLLLERWRVQGKLNGSRGLLGIGAGGLAMVSTFTVPIIAGALLPITPQISATELLQSSPVSVVIEETAEEEPEDVALFITNTPAPAPTLTATPVDLPQLPTMQPTLDRSQPVVASNQDGQEVAMALEVGDCTGVVGNNLNLRDGASTNNAIVLTIPHSSHIDVFGQLDGGGWLSVAYDGNSGWVSADYVTLNSVCGDLPMVDAP